jgi:CheY-like chemotaxis protein
MKKPPLIAIVDDDADDREIVRDAFLAVNSEQSYLFFENGEELVQYLLNTDNDKPALVLLDFNMPGMDGRETLKNLKAHAALSAIPTLVLTTSSSPRDRSLAYTLGANCFISKPDTFQKLTEMAICISKLWLQ